MKEDRTLEVVSVDVAGIMSGKVADVPLKENDVLFIPTKRERMSDRTITIRGEVQFPAFTNMQRTRLLKTSCIRQAD